MIKYSMTPVILNNLLDIERNYGRREALRLSDTQQGYLERKNMIQSSYISTSIDGNPLTQSQVSYFLLANRNHANPYEKDIQNYFEILTRLGEISRENLSLSPICRFHVDLKNGVTGENSGELRGQSARINSLENDSESKQRALEELIAWHNSDTQILPVIKAAVFHWKFAHIQPFSFGNGAVGRLLTALLLIKAGYEVNKYFVLDDYYDLDRRQYFEALFGDNSDSTAWVEYFTAGMIYSLRNGLENALKIF